MGRNLFPDEVSHTYSVAFTEPQKSCTFPDYDLPVDVNTVGSGWTVERSAIVIAWFILDSFHECRWRDLTGRLTTGGDQFRH
jgi:hypothetical protein